MKTHYTKLIQLASKLNALFPSFYLAGGTAIMFKHKHRTSVNLDFFSEKTFSSTRLALKLKNTFEIMSEKKKEDNMDFVIQDIKVSFVFFPFKNIFPIEHFKTIKIASDYDLFLNKIYVAGRRIDHKDSFGAAFLYQKYHWNKTKIKIDFEKKFPHQYYEPYLGALLNFEDYPTLDTTTQKILLQLI